MRKHRKWWMGFGIGVIAGATMLQLITFAKDQEQTLMVTDSPKTYTQQELDEAVSKAVEEARHSPPASASPSAPASTDTAASGPAAKTSSSPSLSNSHSPSAFAPSQKVSFYINPGTNLKTVAGSLLKLGLIDDADDFIDEARRYSKAIRPGTAVFTGKPTYKEIIAELTRPKDN